MKATGPARRFQPLTRKAPSGLKPLFHRPGPLYRQSASLAGAFQEAKETQATSDKVDKKPPQSGTCGDPMVVGLSHHTATVDVRERLSIPEIDWDKASQEIRALEGVSEAGVLSTCNRFEVYLATESPEVARESVLQYVQSQSKLTRATLLDNLFFHQGQAAVDHLFQVSAGFDSLVVGEGQILSQVRSCSMHGNDEAGSFGTILNRLFNTALKAGKRVRTETGISRGAVSISSAAVELAIMRSEEKLSKPLKGARVCIVGAGTMTRLAITHLLSQDVTDIHIVNRGRERMEELASGFPDAELQLHLLDQLWDEMMQADLIITSTSSTSCIVTKDNLAANWKDRVNPLMLVDISVPRNVESEVNDLEKVVAYNVDDLKQVMDANQAKRQSAMIEARKIVEEEISSFWSWKESLQCIPAIKAMRKRGSKIIEDEIAKNELKLSKLSAKERKMVEMMLSSVVNKLMLGPLSELREDTSKVDVADKLALVKAMFNLDLDDA